MAPGSITKPTNSDAHTVFQLKPDSHGVPSGTMSKLSSGLPRGSAMGSSGWLGAEGIFILDVGGQGAPDQEALAQDVEEAAIDAHP